MRRKEQDVANVALDTVVISFAIEEALEPFFGYICCNRRGKEPLAGRGEGSRIQVRSEYLQLWPHPAPNRLFDKPIFRASVSCIPQLGRPGRSGLLGGFVPDPADQLDGPSGRILRLRVPASPAEEI